MSGQTVAVIGAGPSGLSMLKTLLEDGFNATLFERKSTVGGLWAYTDNVHHTVALPTTRANISKYTCGFSDFPMPEKYPHYLSQADFHEYLQSYSAHFNLGKCIVFSTDVKSVTRDENDTHWCVELEKQEKTSIEKFDKVVFAHGYQTRAKMPQFEGSEKFKGVLMHAQQFRNPSYFKEKKVVIVGLGSSAGDVVPAVAADASKVYISHRRGATIFKRLATGTPADLTMTRQRREVGFFLQRWAPGVALWAAAKGAEMLMRKSWGEDGLDPSWRLSPSPNVLLTLPSSAEDVVTLLQEGKVTSLHGLKCFTGPSSIESDDGTVLDGVDAVICCTGYAADFSQTPWLEESHPSNYGGEPIKRLYMNVFPPKYANSACFLTYSAFGKNNGFSFTDVMSMAVSNIWRGVSGLPSSQAMEEDIDRSQEWVASRWRRDAYTDPCAVKQWEWQGFFNDAAGTGLENLGWGLSGWLFYLRNRQVPTLMNHGVETAYMYRFFETGKRKTWSGAEDAIIAANEAVKVFPLEKS